MRLPTKRPGLPGHTGVQGTLGRAGNYGGCWASATSGILGMDLNFHAAYLVASHSDYRGYGFQLRCLSE